MRGRISTVLTPDLFPYQQLSSGFLEGSLTLHDRFTDPSWPEHAILMAACQYDPVWSHNLCI